MRKLAEWGARLERFWQAEISVTRFCRGEQVSVASVYQWRKKVLDDSARQNDWPRAVEAFAPVRLVGTASVAAWLPGGTRIEIPIGDSQVLQLALSGTFEALRAVGGAAIREIDVTQLTLLLSGVTNVMKSSCRCRRPRGVVRVTGRPPSRSPSQRHN